MGGRPVYHAEFGRFVRLAREDKPLGLRQAAKLAASRFPAMTKGAIEGIERGETRHIEPEILRGMAELYGLAYSDLVSRYIASEYGLRVESRDLVWQGGTGDSALPPGGADRESATARIRELEARVRTLETYEAIVDRVRPHILDVLTLIGRKGHSAARKKSRGGSGD